MESRGLIDKNKKEWPEYLKLWDMFKPPARPANFDVKLWEKYIKKLLKENKSVKALVFGSTPEIRDLLAKYKISTSVLEINPRMPERLLMFMKHKNQRKEKVFIRNWLDVNKIFSSNTFDFAIGHMVFNNIPWRLHRKLAYGIRQVLKKDSYLLMASPILGKIKKTYGREIVLTYQNNPRYFKNFSNRWYVIEILKKLDYNKRGRRIFFKKIKQRLIDEIKKQGLPDKVINNLWAFGEYDSVDNYIGVHPPLSELLNILKNYFKVEKILYGPGPEFKNYPEFVLRPKK